MLIHKSKILILLSLSSFIFIVNQGNNHDLHYNTDRINDPWLQELQLNMKNNSILRVESKLKLLNETIHSPIIINSESDLLSSGLPGSGTELDPYLISGISIHEDMEPYSRAIVINNTVSFIKITNCTLIGRTALEIENASNIILSNSFLQGNSALNIRGCSRIQVTNNTCLGSNIYISSSSRISLYNNTCYKIEIYTGTDYVLMNNLVENGNYIGIKMYNCENSTVVGNNCTNNDYAGISFNGCTNSTIIENYCSGSTFGIRFYGNCRMNQIRYNTVIENSRGLSIHGESQYNIFSDNLVIGNFFGIIFEPDRSENYISKYASKNQIFRNVFQSNSRQGYDSGNRNGYGYNFWSDWVNISSDEDHDGILDDPYPLEAGDNVDRYPLASKEYLSQVTITSVPIPASDNLPLMILVLLASTLIGGFFLLRWFGRKPV